MNTKTKKIKTKKWLKAIGITVLVILLLLAIVPLFIPINAEVGLNEPVDLLDDQSKIVTIPFEGTDGIDIFYEYDINEDSEMNFVLLHGSMYNSKSFSEVMDFFSVYGNVYAYDQIPYGYSEKLLEGDWTGQNPYTTQAATEQLILFMDALGIEKVTLVGNSFGGVLAAEAALKYEDRVDSLILIDPAILVSESMPEWILTLPQVEHLGPMLAAGLSEGDQFYQSTFYNKELLTDQRMAYSKRETQINNWNLAMWEYLQAWSVAPSDVGQRLGDIKKAVLVISGEYDEVVPLSDSEEIASALPNATLEVIPDCGHMPHEEKPMEFIEIVENWFGKQ